MISSNSISGYENQLRKTMIATGLRGSIERILGGDVRAADLHTLFFSMRQESGGKGIVSEIAHFIAHPEPRTQGITRDELRDVYAFMKLRAQLNTPLKMTDIPATIPEALRANLRRTRAPTLKRETRTNPRHAKRVLDRILARVGPTGSGGLSKLTIIDAEELALLKLLGSRFKAGPLFTEQDLMKDLSRVLQKTSLLKQIEYSGLTAQKAPISIFALTVMHNHQIELGGGTTAVLAVTSDKLGNLAIFAFADIEGVLMPGKITTVGHWLFQTNLPIARYCEQGVAPDERNRFIGDFGLTAKGMLGRVQ
jgi:hypothetical protein